MELPTEWMSELEFSIYVRKYQILHRPTGTGKAIALDF